MNLPSFLWLWKIAAWSMGLTLLLYVCLAIAGSRLRALRLSSETAPAIATATDKILVWRRVHWHCRYVGPFWQSGPFPPFASRPHRGRAHPDVGLVGDSDQPSAKALGAIAAHHDQCITRDRPSPRLLDGLDGCAKVFVILADSRSP